MKNIHSYGLSLLTISVLSVFHTGCKTNLADLASTASDTDGGVIGKVSGDLAAQCGLECPKEGIAQGNAAISGVASVDGFFAAVVSYQAAADSVSSGIEAQLDAIRADFGFAAGADLKKELSARIKANLDGDLTVQSDPAICKADVQAVVKAVASCDASVDPGMAMLACKGNCTGSASASAKCESSSTLKCTTAAPSVVCMGDCQGSCTAELATAASCTGTCQGSCTGACSAYVKDDTDVLKCNGACDGMCTGSCQTELAASAKCTGTCEGECTVTDGTASCTGSVRSSCEAKAGAMVMCDGDCDGEIEPPKAKAECAVSAQAQAKVNVHCTPAHLAMHYKLAGVAEADIAAQERFVAGLELFRIKLPVLLASIKRADSIAGAGELLTASATGAVKSSFKLVVKGKLSVKETIGLGCALGQLDDVGKTVNASSDRLNADLMSASDLNATVGLKI